MLRLALRSLLNRRFTASLTVIAIGLSVTLFLGVDRVRHSARRGFENTISGTDLIVGARSGPVQMLLYSVFRMGSPTNNMSWESYEELSNRRDVKWIVPISLGDSHAGFRVLGTNQEYFKQYQYGAKRSIEFDSGKPFDDVFDCVIGAQVARDLRYKLGTNIILSHGIVDTKYGRHTNKPFQVVGVLKATGTPIDRTIHVSLEGIEAIHVDWKDGAPPRAGDEVSADEVRKLDLKPHSVTAAFIGLKSKLGIFQLQRWINGYKDEALMAVLPGATLQELWRTVGIAETSLLVVSLFVILTGLIGMVTTILSTLNERRREMAVLRSIGARPFHIVGLLVNEAVLLTVFGCLLGLALLFTTLVITQPILESRFGLFITVESLSYHELMILGVIVALGFIAGCIPAWQAYRNSLSDGLTPRI